MFKKAVVINDQHIPFEDKQANKLVFDFIVDFKPDIIDILGDLCDFWAVSHFDRDPNRVYTIQKELDKTYQYLANLRLLAPQADIELHAGNHLWRLKSYIWNQAKELACIRSLDLSFLLGLNTLKISFVESPEAHRQRGKLILTHGTVVSQDSAMTARRMLKRYGLSVIHGHTHRGGSTYITDMLGIRGAWENFCLCDFGLARLWNMGIPNWQQGFSYIYYYSDRFEIHQVPIIKGKFTAFGKEYK